MPSAELRGRAPIRTLFRPALARDTAGLWIAFFFCLGSIYLVFGWLPSDAHRAGPRSCDGESGLAVYNFGGVLGVLAVGSADDCAGLARAACFPALWRAPPARSRFCWFPSRHTASAPCCSWHLRLNGLLANAVQTSMYRAGRARVPHRRPRIGRCLRRGHRQSGRAF